MKVFKGLGFKYLVKELKEKISLMSVIILFHLFAQLQHFLVMNLRSFLFLGDQLIQSGHYLWNFISVFGNDIEKGVSEALHVLVEKFSCPTCNGIFG